jgi:hypothetical protein
MQAQFIHLELGKSPGIFHFHLWIGSGSTYLRPATKLGGSQVDPGLVSSVIQWSKCKICTGVFVRFLEVEVQL